MTTINETVTILEKARAGRRAALSSLHARLGHTDKVVSIFNNAFPLREAEPEPHAACTAVYNRPVLLLNRRKAA
ncbi:MAG: hypothetical protein CSA74_02900 [Rhodobacterales bacterium]|nr:MAG: hypothetical protein CSA74_02900 [Rhodobacterales bacterium]